MAALQAVTDPLGQWSRTLLQICAYAGETFMAEISVVLVNQN